MRVGCFGSNVGSMTLLQLVREEWIRLGTPSAVEQADLYAAPAYLNRTTHMRHCMHTNEQSPLVAIKQKELELAARLMVARQEAAQEIASAHAWAAQEHIRAEELGRSEAIAELRDQLGQADREAADIRVAGEYAARTQLEHGRAIIPQSVQQILVIVLPNQNVEDIRCCWP
jgi:vacuolar-type H+-ATPase subunit H